MPRVRPFDLPVLETITPDTAIVADNGELVGRTTPTKLADFAAPVASREDAEQGLDNSKRMTALRTHQAIEATAGTASYPKMSDGASVQEAIAVAATPSDLLASTAQYTVGSTIRTADGFIYEVAPADAADAHVETAGGVKLYVVPHQGVYYNIRAFGAVGDNTSDDTAIIQKAVQVATSANGVTFVPDGNYRITSTIALPANAHIVGANRNTAVFFAVGTSFPVLDITGQQTTIAGIYIRGGSIGIRHRTGVGFMSQIVDCRISYNRIGIDMLKAFITTVRDCYIAFNSWGVICGPECFQVVIRDNVIDNNLGGGGVICYANQGVLIAGNTIEGNRKEESIGGPSIGFGLWIVGLAQRTIVRDNWLEQNGNQDGSSDIIIGRPNEAWVDQLVTTCVPTEYQSHFGTNAFITGDILLDGNFFYATKRGITLRSSGALEGGATISNNSFVGLKGRFNRSVDLYGASSSYILDIKENRITNTGDISITTEMNQGIKKSYVYYTGATAPYGAIRLDGVDLFTAYLTSKEFLSFPGASLDATSRVPSSGNATLMNGVFRSVHGSLGCRVVTGTGRPRAGTTGLLTPGTENVWILLASGNGSGVTITAGASFPFFPANDAQGRAVVSVGNPTTAEAVLHTGDYYGWIFMTRAQFDASTLRGIARLVVTDLDVVETDMVGSGIPTSWPLATSYVWPSGTKVYEQSPAAGGSIGYVCVSGGSPGTWKTFGGISA